MSKQTEYTPPNPLPGAYRMGEALAKMILHTNDIGLHLKGFYEFLDAVYNSEPDDAHEAIEGFVSVITKRLRDDNAKINERNKASK